MSSGYEIGMDGQQRRFFLNVLRRLAEDFASHDPLVLDQGSAVVVAKTKDGLDVRVEWDEFSAEEDFDRPEVKRLVRLVPPPTAPGSKFVVSSDGTVLEHKTRYFVYKVYPHECER